MRTYLRRRGQTEQGQGGGGRRGDAGGAAEPTQLLQYADSVCSLVGIYLLCLCTYSLALETRIGAGSGGWGGAIGDAGEEASSIH